MDNKNCLALETELRLGLPGATVKDKKRLFADISAPVVGWPPVCSYRRRNVGIKMYVKVSVDGAPFLRKIDLSNHKCYSHLVMALEQLFGCFGIGEALKDAENCEYVPIYEDKDGDWMLLGDVPWGMFAESCKRLRIMKKSDAKRIGLHAKDLLKGLATED
ncbi:auxin-induced protein 22C-like [Salvia miltiorrhiza]|uniref:auxin-induced protein 22C-like n=1 Tax=Salvia miltiorrhiza TaxID=226208 RepID=UPI0025ACB31C|nr:auxin-induced protein 22C-like [Salvia miltiorrhiza]